MKNLNVFQPLSGGSCISRFNAARVMAKSLAESDPDLIEPELIAWHDSSTAMASPVLEGCSGADGWHDYGVSHNGRLEVNVDGLVSFIFTDASSFDSYQHFGPGPFINIRDAQGQEMICRVGGKACVPLDEWSSKLT